jgi:putative PIN family toxin of toxin-antitoxin system
MPVRRRIVIDTNVYVSHILNPGSTPSRALLKAQQSADILISKVIFDELAEVITRSKFDRYFSIAVRQTSLDELFAAAILFEPETSLIACRDPKDDKFLELAVDGHADLILTGDHDLLALHPFRGIAIVTPMQYLAED